MGFKIDVCMYVCEHRPVSVQFLFLAADILQNTKRWELDLLLLFAVRSSGGGSLPPLLLKGYFRVQ
jgi:hypothetical protein